MFFGFPDGFSPRIRISPSNRHVTTFDKVGVLALVSDWSIGIGILCEDLPKTLLVFAIEIITLVNVENGLNCSQRSVAIVLCSH